MGPLAIVLLLGALNAVALAALILRASANRTANRLLSALLVLVALRLCIYVLGFAGVYDAHPTLTFLPLDLSAAFAPLFWLYARAIIGALPRGWAWHLSPAALQFAYQGLCFLLPPDAKWDWYAGPHLRVIAPSAMAAILLAGAIYLAAAWRDQARYQAWLDTRFADRDRWRLTWLRTMILVFAALIAFTAAMAAWHILVRPLDYFSRTPVIFGFSALAYVFGLLGWRHGATDYPRDVASGGGERMDYAATADGWIDRIEAAQWWREESLTLGLVAARLGVSERSLSRALNDGAGRSFNATINGMRVRAIQRALAEPTETRDLLTLALDHGFASKASFNRAFRQATGTTPSDWRRKIRQTALTAHFEATP